MGLYDRFWKLGGSFGSAGGGLQQIHGNEQLVGEQHRILREDQIAPHGVSVDHDSGGQLHRHFGPKLQMSLKDLLSSL